MVLTRRTTRKSTRKRRGQTNREKHSRIRGTQERVNRRKLSSQYFGYHEHQVLGTGPEAQESARAARECKKNPGHKTFIPVEQLTRNHLPKLYQDDDEFLESIKIAADLTVRLRVGLTSPERPSEGYYGKSGMTRTGTGYVAHVEPNHEPCRCSSCRGKPKRSRRKSWVFLLMTAKHVVFDEIEAKMTWVDFFYDDEESRFNGGMKSVMGGRVELDTDYKSDYGMFLFSTCDTELGTKLMDLHSRRENLELRLRELYYADESRSRHIYIVSHPHGIAKHVTFGKIHDEIDADDDDDHSLYKYSAGTCPGSSGAKILELGCGTYYTLIQAHHCYGGPRRGWNFGMF